MTAAQVTATFSEEDHPRSTEGSTAGQFAKKDGSSSSKTPAKKAAPAKTSPKRRGRTRRVIPKGQLGFDGVSGTGYGVKGGDKRVRALQEELNRLGLTDARGRKLRVDGELGPLTTQAIRDAQRRLGMKPTGIIAPAFIDRLRATKAVPKTVKKAASAKARPGRVRAKFDPSQPRDPDGKWGDGIPGPGGAIKDALKLASRIQLGEGETLAGSDVVRGNDSVMPMAWTDGPAGRKLRLGTGIDQDDERRWRGADRGQTVVLDEAGVAHLGDAIREMREAGTKAEADEKRLTADVERLRSQQRDIIRRQYPNLTKAQAKKLDETDEQIQHLTEEIRREEERGSSAFAELPGSAKARHAEIEAEIDRLGRERAAVYSDFWADGGKDTSKLDRAKEIGLRIEALLDEQDGLHDQREGGRLVGYSTLAKKRRRKLDDLRSDLDGAQRERAELTTDSKPLSAEDEAELARVSAAIEQNDEEYGELIDSGDAVAEGVVSAQWGDLAWHTRMTDTGPQYTIGVRPPDAAEDWYLGEDESYTNLDDTDLAALERKLRGGPGGSVKASRPVTAAELRGIELARPGRWKLASGPMTVTKQHLIDAARYAQRASARPGYVKIGHNDPRFAPGDGEPALGWVHNVRYAEDERGPKLVGDIHDMPDWLAAAAPTAWPDRSIEGWADFTDEDGEKYALVVDGVALLGVTPPGMSSIQSLRDLPKAVGVAAASGVRVVASMSSAPMAVEKGAGQMDPAITRKALGLSADAPDDEVASALEAAATALRGDPAPAPVQASLFGDEPTPAPTSKTPVTVPGTVVIASSIWDETQKTIKALTDFVAKTKRDERDEYIAKAVQAGKFTPAQRQTFMQLWDENPEYAKKAIDALVPNSALAVLASGYAGGVEVQEDELDREIARLSQQGANRG